MGNENLPENRSVDDSTKQKDLRQPDESQVLYSTSSNTIDIADSKAIFLRTKIPQTLMTTSSTLFEPSERSISTTTIREGVLSEPLRSSPVFKNGHGVCCDPNLIK